MQHLREVSDGILVDVRTPQEQAGGVLPGALLVPMARVVDSVPAIRQAAAGRPVYVYCKIGIRAARAVGYLRDRGIDARNIGGLEKGLAKTLFARVGGGQAPNPTRRANLDISCGGCGGLGFLSVRYSEWLAAQRATWLRDQVGPRNARELLR